MLMTQGERFSQEEVRAPSHPLPASHTLHPDRPPSPPPSPSHKPLLCHLFTLALSRQIDQMFAAFPPDISGNLDYKNLVHVITHGEEKD